MDAHCLPRWKEEETAKDSITLEVDSFEEEELQKILVEGGMGDKGVKREHLGKFAQAMPNIHRCSASSPSWNDNVHNMLI